jgi:hypothetical protein
LDERGDLLVFGTGATLILFDASTGERVSPTLFPAGRSVTCGFKGSQLRCLSHPHYVLKEDEMPPWYSSSTNWFQRFPELPPVAFEQYRVNKWDVSPQKGEIDDLRALITVIANRRLDATPALTAISVEERKSAWKRYKEIFPSPH